ncbi:exodeoxyribonuclease V subunit beta [Moellerella wisconsensis]|uniref:exodeoxyribonuclease V subunit beta n=1 Tax=Moellerella wisconsensis TaxID=158849 RepID=UPI0030760EF0
MSETQIQSQQLDPYTLPLYGQRLIEASAGTGKTYTIGILYLRLLLGLGGESAFSRPLTVEDILVVTFTEAATNELRGRIRQRIHDMRLACIRNGKGYEEQTEYRQLLSEMPDEKQRLLAAQWLLLAERQMDESAIYTIHGFCQRMLVHNAFESGVLFEQTMVKDEYPVQKQACADYWRRHFYPLDYSMAKVIASEWSGPDALLSDIKPFLQGDMPIIVGAANNQETLIERHQRLIASIEQIKALWLTDADNFNQIISASDVDKRSYSSRHLPSWIAKITLWAASDTVDYQLPKDLERFSAAILATKSKSGQPPEHAVFQRIENLLSQPLTLRDLIIPQAIVEVRQTIEQEKQRRSEMGFDDLLTRLDKALSGVGGELLADTIRQRYPVAMIDEFQDTDPQQYRIFQRIYRDKEHSGLLFIGDPKQAIYAFRGADIFTYIEARKHVNAHYTLETNYRSSESMVKAVNSLFNRLGSPFLFDQIPYHNVNSAPHNANKQLYHNGTAVKALTFWQPVAEAISVTDYEQIMATQCAEQIAQWLQGGRTEKTQFYHHDKPAAAVKASDITVLVRSRREAILIRDALNQRNIPSVFQSNRESVFETPEAKDLLWLLQAVLTPEKERVLRSALACGLFGLNSLDIECLNNDEKAWEQLVDEFTRYSILWNKRGVLPMLRAVMTQRHVAENLLSAPEGERRLMDLMHIGELLQEMSLQLEGEHALIRWLAQQISRPDPQAERQQMRLESDKHLVQISTIHKSKGLEYKIVWLPFVCNFIPQAKALYHDRQDYRTYLDLSDTEKNIELADEERLSEDLRLLYVALTRSIYHCSVGIAPLIKGNRKKSGDTDLHLSAIGYLLQQGKEGDIELLNRCLAEIRSEWVDVAEVKPLAIRSVDSVSPDRQSLAARKFTRQLNSYWKVTSYSGLSYGTHQHENASSVSAEVLADSLAPKMDIDARGEARDLDSSEQVAEQQLTAHQFPKGAMAGTFLHSVLEEADFQQPIDEQWLADKLLSAGFDPMWAQILKTWLQTIFNTPLNEQGLILSQLKAEDQLDEMQFYLPIDKLLTASELDELTHYYDPLSSRCPPLNFDAVQGILKGFIDLTFYWQGKFYLLDYKSNYLGDGIEAYTREAMEEAMIDHRYDLQYQLYSLALHRYLRQRLPDYNYEQHFGGVIYLFLRGIDADYPGNGVFYYLPAAEFVDKLDRLFSQAEENQKC